MMDTPEKAKAPTVAAEGALTEPSKQRQFSAKSTHSQAQRDRIIQALRLRPQTTTDLRKMGIFQAPARVKELRDKFGYVIDTERVALVDEHGYLHPGAARYTLKSEPATN
jgi:hypothetical protein